MGALLRVVLAFGVAGCHCRPDPSVPDTDVDDTARPASTAETAAPPRCELEESESNNTAETADGLPLEAEACGGFQAPNDPDLWTFEVVDSTWLGVWLDARENGSLANPGLFLLGPDNLVIARDNGDETADVQLRFPAAVGTYTLTVREEGFQGDDDGRWFYDLEATVQKAPREWTSVEAEPNGTPAQATPIGVGAVYGVIEDPDDQDVYALPIPFGRHTLRARIDAFAYGSPADTRLYLQDADGDSPGCGASNPNCRFERGQIGFETDPWLEYSSEGDEVLQLRVISDDGRGSAIHWYVLDVTLEVP